MTTTENVQSTRPLMAGDVIQYRKVGTARLVARDEAVMGDSERYAATQEGWWTLEWIKAPKKYREGSGTFWISLRDRLA